MFNPVQIKHEYMEIEDIKYDGTINHASDFKCSTFTNVDFDYKYSQLPSFWGHTQTEIQPKMEIHDQQCSFQTQENNFLTCIKEEYVQNSALFQVNQDSSLNQSQVSQQCHIEMVQKEYQAPFFQGGQQTRYVNEMSTALQPMLSIKPNLFERTPTASLDNSTEEKFKCQCEVCFKEFRHKSNLFIHMRIHSGERPYKCHQCEKCFTHSGNLAIHMRTHSGERPYACQVCGKMFSHSGNLSTHLRTHSGIKPYKCTVCGKEFRHSGNLSIHERIHSGIKPFKCKVCGKDFYHSGNLTTHMKKHVINIDTSIYQHENNEKPPLYVTAAFNNTQSLNSHNNLSLTQTTDVDLVTSTNNMVPIKNENSYEVLTNTLKTPYEHISQQCVAKVNTF